MKIGIIGAMEEEVQLLIKEMKVFSEEIIGMRTYYSGMLFNQDVVLAFSRWGKVAAASTVTTLIQKYNVDLVLFTGVAGALNSSLNVGDIVIADNLTQYDMDVSGLPGFNKFEIPLLGKGFFSVDPALAKLAKKSAQYYLENEMKQEINTEIINEFGLKNPQVIVGGIASGDQFVTDGRKIRNMFTADDYPQCVEMEGAAVAQVCYEHGVKYVVFRVISDKADEHANIDFKKFIEHTASHFTKGIIKQIMMKLTPDILHSRKIIPSEPL